ncbi:DUF721 domain-containing protein [Flavobacterium sp.]|uniref:DUF721 domain-containing protein n=1 Tax=Flavobacterium sp. TaxID=239 RepID=UPI00261D8A6B|nr:DUF721 domain-containing protein [Flavobacterium sp.]
MKSNENSIAAVLQELIARNKWQRGLDKTEVPAAWFDVMGSGVKSYTLAVDFNEGTLYVQLSSSVLRQELQFGKDKIVKMLNEHLRRDVVKEVVLR